MCMVISSAYTVGLSLYSDEVIILLSFTPRVGLGLVGIL